jgi:hypothetical protein
MRELFGFAAGVTAASLAALFLKSEEGQKMLRRLYEEAGPDIDEATREWEPILREVARAVKLGADELSGAVDRLASYLATLADEPPAEPDPELKALPASADAAAAEA